MPNININKIPKSSNLFENILKLQGWINQNGKAIDDNLFGKSISSLHQTATGYHAYVSSSYWYDIEIEHIKSDFEQRLDADLSVGEKKEIVIANVKNDIHTLFAKLVVRGCFKTKRDYEIAKLTLLEMTGIDYESEI